MAESERLLDEKWNPESAFEVEASSLDRDGNGLGQGVIYMTGKSIAVVRSAVFTMFAAAIGCFNPQYRENMPCSGPGDCPPDHACVHDTCVSCQPVEFCNMVDDDCDGVVDEECPCVDGDVQACGPGYCPDEKNVCVNGQWSSCEGARQPQTERCDGIMDEDCDGAIDEGDQGLKCPCAPVGEIVRTDCGPCADGVQRCTASGFGACESASPKIDCCPGEIKGCGCGSTGTQTCTSGGRWSNCVGETRPTESCNGADDDCDGDIDEAPCPACLKIGNILVHDMAPSVAGDDEFAGHGPLVRITTTYSISGGGSRVCARVFVTMQETNGGTSLARKTVSACSDEAPGKIVDVRSVNSVHSYTDIDASAGSLWDILVLQNYSGIETIRCIGDTGGPDICNGGSNFTDCSKCELLNVCPYVIYGQ